MLFLLNDAPYGSERTYNALRLAGSSSRQEGVAVKVFLMGDAVASARTGQKTPDGYYNVERMLKGIAVKVFLMGDAVASAKSGQKVPSGYYNAATMLGAVVRHGGAVGACGSCLDARGIGEAELLEGAHRSSMDELTTWTLESDKVLVF